ncbi:MAG: hypothetical protein ACM3NS_06095 [Deltaproteobacteria bacterium]|jgi:hypothetical protein
MRIVTVQYLPYQNKVDFSPNNGHVAVNARDTITFKKGGSVDFDFEGFSLTPEDLTQFPRTVLPDHIDVQDLFTDKQETWYKYTVVIRLRDGTQKVGDPQIVNKPQ